MGKHKKLLNAFKVKTHKKNNSKVKGKPIKKKKDNNSKNKSQILQLDKQLVNLQNEVRGIGPKASKTPKKPAPKPTASTSKIQKNKAQLKQKSEEAMSDLNAMQI